jgi:hypothetical protein
VRCSEKRLIDFLEKTENLKKIDPMMEIYERLEERSESEYIVYTAFSSPVMGVARRDFVSKVSTQHVTADTWVQVTRAIEHHAKPERKPYVRGELHCHGYVVSRLDDNRLQVNLVLSLDPKGWVPTSAVDATNMKQLLKLQRLKELAEEEEKIARIVSPDLIMGVSTEGPSPADVQFLLSLKNSDGWSIVRDSDGILFESKTVEWCSIKACRFTTTVKCRSNGLQMLADFLSKTENIIKIDPLIEVYEKLQEINDTDYIVYTSFKSPMMGVARRDFVNKVTTQFITPDTWVHVTKAFEHPSRPERKPYVRGELHCHGYVATKKGESHFEFCLVLSMDPKGWVPTSAVDNANMKQLQKLERLKECMENM